MNIKIPLTSLLLLGLIGCVNEDNLQTSTIEKVLMCTEPSGNWASGPIPSECRVQLVNGDRLNLRAPVAEGDVIRYDRNGYVY